MSQFFDTLDSLPNPRVLFVNKQNEPVFAFSQSGVETLSYGPFVGDDILRWGEIERVFIIRRRLGSWRIPTIRLVNLDALLQRLSDDKSERLNRMYRSWRGGVGLDFKQVTEIRIEGTEISVPTDNSYETDREWIFSRVVARFKSMDIRTIDEGTPEYKLYIPEGDWRDYPVES